MQVATYVKKARLGFNDGNLASGRTEHAMPKNTICLWYDKDAEAAARFYAETFPYMSTAERFYSG